MVPERLLQMNILDPNDANSAKVLWSAISTVASSSAKSVKIVSSKIWCHTVYSVWVIPISKFSVTYLATVHH